jgi:hypothetical protein
MSKSLIFAGLALGLVAASPALAECDTVQEKMVGEAISMAIVHSLPASASSYQDEAIDILTCEGGGRKFEATFRYSFIADGKEKWVEGRVFGIDDHINSVRVYRYSPNWSSKYNLALAK